MIARSTASSSTTNAPSIFCSAATAASVAAALSYGELAGMMPHAGGQYVYLREAYSPMWGFLYGWTLFLVIQTGTIAAVDPPLFRAVADFSFERYPEDRASYHVSARPERAARPGARKMRSGISGLLDAPCMMRKTTSSPAARPRRPSVCGTSQPTCSPVTMA